MLEFVITNVILVSFGIIIYVVVRTLPRIDSEDIDKNRKESIFERIMTCDIPHKIDYIFNNYTGKILRRTKVFILRFDNYLSRRLKDISSSNHNNKPKIDFSGIKSGKKDNKTARLSDGNDDSLFLEEDEEK